MRTKILKEIEQNAPFYTRDSITLEHLKVSKFFHGSPKDSKSVMFFVSYAGKPLCIFKISRKKEWNSLIERKKDGLLFGLKQFPGLVPKLFFSGEIDACAYICQEIIDGEPIGGVHKKKGLETVFKLHSLFPRGEEVKVADVLELWNRSGVLTTYPEFQLLKKRQDENVFFAKQHGDLTDKNILIKEDRSVQIIDWENFGLRNVWGTDLVHHLTRSIATQHDSEDVHSYLPLFLDEAEKYFKQYAVSIERPLLEKIFLFDRLFDTLQKDHPIFFDEYVSFVKQNTS